MSATVSLTTFGGMTNDEHDPSTSACVLSKGFDIYTRPHRLSPRRSSESGYASQNTVRLVNFAYSDDNDRLYALGTLSGATSLANILFTSAIDTPTWTSPANNADSSGVPSSNLFVPYHDYIYGASAGNRLWRHDQTGTNPFASSWQSLSYSFIGQGLIHSQDDTLYIPYDNKIASWDNSSFNAVALELPSRFQVASISEYGNYLAIACRPVSGYGNSRMFLWDRDQSLSTVSESIDWGEGALALCGELQGALIGISIVGANTSVQPKVVFKAYTSNGAETFLEIVATAVPSIVTKQKVNDGLYFLMKIEIDGEEHQGIWSVTGSASKGFSVVHEYLPDNDTALDPSTGLLHGFGMVGGYAYISYENGGTFFLSKTDDQATFASTSIRTTTYNQGMAVADRPKQKRLEAVSLSYMPLPSGASVTLEYRVDSEDWTTVFTETADDAVATEMTTANGTAFTDGRNYQFRISSTGGAEITGLQYRYSAIETNL